MLVSRSIEKASVIIGGDVTFTGRTENHLQDRRYEDVWGDTRALVVGHDHAICNLECPLIKIGEPIKKIGPNLKGDPLMAEFLKQWGFSAVTLANNHIMDYGPQGLESTLQSCQDAGLEPFGAGENLDKASKPHRVVLRGGKLSFVAAAEEEFCIAGEDAAGVSPLQPIPLYRRLQAEMQWADHVVVIFHGGNEYFPYPRPNLQEFARFCIDIGASAVVGCHSHVMGAYEEYRGCPIFYGIGNLLFDQDNALRRSGAKSNMGGWNEGILVSLEFSRGAKPNYRMHPYRQSAEEPGIRLLAGAEHAAALDRLESLRSTTESEDALRDVWLRFCADRLAVLPPFIAPANNRVLRKIAWLLVKNGLLPSRWWMRVVLNIIRCESHRERVVTHLEKALRE